MKSINVLFSDDEFEQLTKNKGDRTWHDALLQEFDVSDEDAQS
jgi:hypothetical protein